MLYIFTIRLLHLDALKFSLVYFSSNGIDYKYFRKNDDDMIQCFGV